MTMPAFGQNIVRTDLTPVADDTAAILARLGDPTGDTLATLVAKLGDLSTSLATKLEPTKTEATFTFSADTTVEQTVFTLSPAVGEVIDVDSIILDVNALTQNCTIKVQQTTNDGATWRDLAVGVYVPGTDPPLQFAEGVRADNTHQVRVRMVSAVNEGANRSVPYLYWSRQVA